MTKQQQFKVIFIGKSQTGKSTLINKLCDRNENNLITPIGTGEPETHYPIRITHNDFEIINIDEINNSNLKREYDVTNPIHDIRINFKNLAYIQNHNINFDSFEIYDMPGTGECGNNDIKNNKFDTNNYLNKYEEIVHHSNLIFVLISPESVSDQILWNDTIKYVINNSAMHTKIYFVYNKIDTIKNFNNDTINKIKQNIKKKVDGLKVDKDKINNDIIFISADNINIDNIDKIWSIISKEYNEIIAGENINDNEYDNKKMAIKLMNYLSRLQNNEETMIIPENIFKKAKDQFEKHKLACKIATHSTTNLVGAGSMITGASIGSIFSPVGTILGSAIGGIIWSITGATGNIVDNFTISGKIIEDKHEKKYSEFKNYCFGHTKEFSEYFDKSFNDKYEDDIHGIIKGNIFVHNINKTYPCYDYGFKANCDFNKFAIDKVKTITIHSIENPSFIITFDEKYFN